MNRLTVLSILALYLHLASSNLVCWECEEAVNQADCLRKGKAVECLPGEDFCFTTLRHGGWGPEPWIEKTCKTLKACADNHIQNARRAWSAKGEMIQCNENYPSSVCRCCCQGDLCNQNQTSCLFETKCSDLRTPRHGKMSCYNGFELDSECNFECNRGYYMDGVSALHCDAFGKWDYPEPRCKILKCSPMRAPEFGTRRCTRGRRKGSRCDFTCQENFILIGRPSVTCLDDEDGDGEGLWSGPQPVCQAPRCDEQRPLRHGVLECSNENNVGSRCTFTCNVAEGYELYPDESSHILTCLRSGEWDHPRPCCTLPCPPFAVMDLTIVLDSSSSVGLENWRRMTRFVESFLSEFNVRDDASHIAIIRYNAFVDEDHQILFNTYPDNRTALIEAFHNIPYDGQGTATGAALNYVNDVILRTGNRPLARDVVLLITDGKATDRVALPARRLRSRNRELILYVLPVQARSGAIDLNEIREIVGRGNEDNILTDALERGFEALDEAFAEKIQGLLCDQPCFNPLHGHPDDARDF